MCPSTAEYCRYGKNLGSWPLSSRRTVIRLSVNPQSPRVRDNFSLVIAGISMSFPSVNVPEPRLESPVTDADVGLFEYSLEHIYDFDSDPSHWPERLWAILMVSRISLRQVKLM